MSKVKFTYEGIEVEGEVISYEQSLHTQKFEILMPQYIKVNKSELWSIILDFDKILLDIAHLLDDVKLHDVRNRLRVMYNEARRV